jgi:peptidoglycan/LPS O-acetylase OafA/YrhL
MTIEDNARVPSSLNFGDKERSALNAVSIDDSRHSKRSLNALTGLRFLAAANVVFYHFIQRSLPARTYPLQNIVGAGYVSVSLFFLLSGFILSFSYIDVNGKIRGTRKNFYIARFARIYPAYFLAFLLAAPSNIMTSLHVNHIDTAVVKLFTGAFLVLTLQQAWTPWTAWYWNFPAWSISVEAFFYLVFPFIAPRLARLRLSRCISLAFGLWLLALCAPAALYMFHGTVAAPGLNDHLQMAVEFNPLLRLPEFMIGILLGRAYNLGAFPKLNSTLLSYGATILILGVFAFCPFLPHPLLANGLLLPLFGALIYSLARGKGLLAYFLASPTMILLGEASYGMYILQIPLSFVLMMPPPHRSLTTFAIYFVCLVCASILSWRFFESPLRVRLRGWLTAADSKKKSLLPTKDYSWSTTASLSTLKEVD